MKTTTTTSSSTTTLTALTHQRVRELSKTHFTDLRRFAQQGIHRAELELRPGALQRLEAEDLVQEVVFEILAGAESAESGYHPEPHDVRTLPQFLDWMRTLIRRRIANAGLIAAASPELSEPNEITQAEVAPAPMTQLPSELDQSFAALRAEYADQHEVLEVLDSWQMLLKG